MNSFENINEFRVTGFAAKDAVTKSTPSGKPYVELRLGHSISPNREETSWFNLVFWNELAERASKVKKGDHLLVEGFFKTESWISKESSQRVYKQVIVIQAFDVLNTKADRQSARGGQVTTPKPKAGVGSEGGAITASLPVTQAVTPPLVSQEVGPQQKANVRPTPGKTGTPRKGIRAVEAVPEVAAVSSTPAHAAVVG